MDIELTDLDQQVKMSFDNFVNEALRSVSLGKIARQPMGACEATMSDQFRDTLDDQFGDGARVLREENRYYPNGNRYRHDIVVEFNSGKDGVMEVKTPFTNHDGITNKTRKQEHLPKDVDALKAALDAGASAAYALIVPIGCYPVDVSGNMIVMDAGLSPEKNEAGCKEKLQNPVANQKRL